MRVNRVLGSILICFSIFFSGCSLKNEKNSINEPILTTKSQINDVLKGNRLIALAQNNKILIVDPVLLYRG